jgi:hypothetical protein
MNMSRVGLTLVLYPIARPTAIGVICTPPPDGRADLKRFRFMVTRSGRCRTALVAWLAAHRGRPCPTSAKNCCIDDGRFSMTAATA